MPNILIRILKYFKKPKGAAYIFLLPAILTLLVFVFVPLIYAVVISFQDVTIFLNPPNFVGFSNYERMFHDDRFWNALKNTFIFLFEVPLQVILGLIVAVLLSKNTVFQKFARTVFFIPTICSLTAVGIVWSFLLDPQIGILPYYLFQLGLPRLKFLSDPNMAMPVIILTTVWKNFGLTMMILISGIQGIPQVYYEASKIDGANSIIQFFKITLPLLIPSLGFCIITNTIGSFQVFDQIYVMTQGGPLHTTETLVMYIYNVGFATQPFNLSYASAIAVILFIIIMVISLLTNNYITQRETVDISKG
ncbi:MAG: sugar ABC transporter permease [Anaerolineaceae bacterium]|nr:sugar ABC transporter permease [Anaerolineaceae bacterium]